MDRDALNVEVVLTPDEWSRGCIVPVLVRAMTVDVVIPARSPPGSVFELPVRGGGIFDFYLRVQVVVKP